MRLTRLLAGKDSAYAPTDAQLDAFYAAGVRVFGGYIKLGNDGIYHGWTAADFARVKAHGMVAVAYMSGWDDPTQARAVATSWGVSVVIVDIENGIRPDGTWVQGWLNTAHAGEYGNAAVHHYTATIHEDAGYFGYDPKASWPAWIARPAGVCGWQWQGSHGEFGLTVDSAWWDDSIAGALAGDSAHSIGGSEITPQLANVLIRLSYFQIRGGEPSPTELNNWLAKCTDDASTESVVIGILDSAESSAYHAKISAVLAAGPAQPDNDPAPIPGPEGPAGKDGAPGAPGVSPDPAVVTNNVLQRLIDALARALGLK